MKKDKFVLITIDYPPQVGGVARYLGELVREAGEKMRVIVPVEHGTEGPGTVETHRMFWKMWPRWIPTVQVCRSQAKDGVLLVSHVFPIGTAAWISRLLGGPEYAVLFHGLDLRLVNGFMKRWLLRRICASAKRLHVNSESTKKTLETLVPGASPVILTPGVRLPERTPTREGARRQLSIGQEDRVVVSLCRLVERKGIDVALEAVGNLQKKQSIRYIVLGSGKDEARLKKIAEKESVSVQWVTSPSDEEKWMWLSAADVFLLPVREEKDDVEGFGIVFLEAAAVCVPSVAGKGGGVSEAVIDGQTGVLVDPRSAKEVEEVLERMFADGESRKRLGEQAKQRALREFQWKDRWAKLSASLEA